MLTDLTIFIVLVLLLLLVEYKYGKLKRAWYTWLIFVTVFFTPWILVAISGISRDLQSLGLIAFATYGVFAPIRWRLTNTSILMLNEPSENNPHSRSIMWQTKHPRLGWASEIIGCTALASIASVGFTFILSLVADPEASMDELFIKPANFFVSLTLWSLWSLPTFASVFVCRLSCLRKIPPFGILVGLLVAVVLTVCLKIPVGVRLIPVFTCPVIGGYAGEKLAKYVIKQETEKNRNI